MSEELKPCPKFAVGQIVIAKSTRKQLPMRVLAVLWRDGWIYQWNKNNWASEEMLRPLTDEEIGTRAASPEGK